MITGQRDVKVFTHEKEVMEQFDVINQDLCKASTTATTVTSMVGPILNNLSHIFYAITCAVGVLWLTGEGAGGILIGFLQYVRTFADRVSQISEQFNALMMALAGAERIFGILDLPPEEDRGQVTLEQKGDDYHWRMPDGTLVPLRGDVRFDHVDFAYVPEKPVLRDLSLYAKPGQKIAFVGSTGAGKTTITNLINRFYDIQAGSITYDGQELLGKPINKILEAGIAQSPEGRRVFANLTVLENLKAGAYLRKDKDGIEKDIKWVYELFPRLEERNWQLAGTLSGGEQQMLAVGRALMSRPKLLMLDEPSLGLAPLVVQGIFDIIRTVNEQGVTVLLIEQNANMALKIADYAYVLETGNITKSGTGAELLADESIKEAYLGKKKS